MSRPPVAQAPYYQPPMGTTVYAANDPSQIEAPKSSSNVGLWIVLILVALIAIAALVLAIILNNNNTTTINDLSKTVTALSQPPFKIGNVVTYTSTAAATAQAIPSNADIYTIKGATPTSTFDYPNGVAAGRQLFIYNISPNTQNVQFSSSYSGGPFFTSLLPGESANTIVFDTNGVSIQVL